MMWLIMVLLFSLSHYQVTENTKFKTKSHAGIFVYIRKDLTSVTTFIMTSCVRDKIDILSSAVVEESRYCHSPGGGCSGGVVQKL